MTIPDFLSHLPVFAGMPVPFTVFWHDGKPDFRVTDINKRLECYGDSLCAICGRTMLGAQFWFIGGPASMDSGMFTDGPMHKNCAEYSIKVCPFLAGKRTEAQYSPCQQTGQRKNHNH